MWQVLVPGQSALADSGWSTTFLMQVSPLRTVEQALAEWICWPAQEGGGTE